MMRKLTVLLAALFMLCPAGCRRVEFGNDDTSQSESRRVATNATDPFLSINYDEADVARPGDPKPKTPVQPDPMDQFFQELGAFGNISQTNEYVPPAATRPISTIPSSTATPAQPVTQAQQPSRPVQQVPVESRQTTRQLPPTQPQYTQHTPLSGTSNTYVSRSAHTPLPVTPVSYESGSTGLVAMTETGPHHISLIYPSPEYGVIKMDKIIPKEVSLNRNFTYSIVITNLTNTTLAKIVLAEAMDDNYDFVSAAPATQMMSNQLLWNFDSLGPKAVERIEITGAARSMNALKHNTTLTYAVTASANIHVVQPKLDLARKVPAEVLLCESFAIEYVIQNTGTGTAKEVKILESLPDGLTTVDGSPEVNFNVGSLRSGQSRSFSVELRANRKGLYINKAQAVSASNITVESTPSATTVRQPALVVSKNGAERQYLGRPLSYEITVINKGDGIAKNTILEETIPVDITGIEASAGTDVSGSRLRWELGTIPANSSKTVRVAYKPTKAGIFTSDTTVNAYCTEPVNSLTRTAVVGIPVIRIDVVDLEDPVELGRNVTYIITASNDGSAPDHNLRLVCQLEDKLQYVSSSGATHASVMGQTLNFVQLRTLAPNTKATWRIVAKAVRAGDIRFRATLTSDELTRPIEETEASYLYD
jgi:hypothetical protein